MVVSPQPCKESTSSKLMSSSTLPVFEPWLTWILVVPLMAPFSLLYFLVNNVLIMQKMLGLIDTWLLIGYSAVFLSGLAVLLRKRYESIFCFEQSER